jgi:hypothetical protein
MAPVRSISVAAVAQARRAGAPEGRGPRTSATSGGSYGPGCPLSRWVGAAISRPPRRPCGRLRCRDLPGDHVAGARTPHRGRRGGFPPCSVREHSPAERHRVRPPPSSGRSPSEPAAPPCRVKQSGRTVWRPASAREGRCPRRRVGPRLTLFLTRDVHAGRSDARSRRRLTTWATRARSASWARIVAPWRSATEAIMQSTIPRGVMPAVRQVR